MENKEEKYMKDQNKRTRKITNPKTKVGKHQILNKNSERKKLRFKIATIALSLGLVTSGIFSMKDMKENALDEYYNQTAIEERYPDKFSEGIEDREIYEIPELHEHSDIVEDLKRAELETLIKLIKDYELQQYIDINIENNNYIVGDNKLALDDYYLYQAVNSPNKNYNEYLEIAFALPILNSKNIDKDSHEYKVARDLMIKNAMVLKDHSEKMVKDKLEEALNTIKRDDVKSNPDKYVEYSNLMYAVYNGKVEVKREKDLDSDAPILTDYIKYKDMLIAKAGKKAGKSFFASEKPLIDGIDNSIINPAISRGEIVENSQIYDARINELDEMLDEKINSGELSNEEINELKSKIKKKKEKYKKEFSEIATKVANNLEFQASKKITYLNLENGKTVERDTKGDSFTEHIKDPTAAYFAKEIFDDMNKKEEPKSDQEQSVEEKETVENYKDVGVEEILDDNKGNNILNDEQEKAEKEKEKDDDPYDIGN